MTCSFNEISEYPVNPSVGVVNFNLCLAYCGPEISAPPVSGSPLNKAIYGLNPGTDIPLNILSNFLLYACDKSWVN